MYSTMLMMELGHRPLAAVLKGEYLVARIARTALAGWSPSGTSKPSS